MRVKLMMMSTNTVSIYTTAIIGTMMSVTLVTALMPPNAMIATPIMSTAKLIQ